MRDVKIHRRSANRCLEVNWLWTTDECRPWETPSGVINVITTPLLIPVISIKRFLRNFSFSSYSLEIVYGWSENFISTRCTILSTRLITRSSYVPLVSLPFTGMNRHAEDSVAIPAMPRACLICGRWRRQISSNEKPSHDTTLRSMKWCCQYWSSRLRLFSTYLK